MIQKILVMYDREFVGQISRWSNGKGGGKGMEREGREKERERERLRLRLRLTHLAAVSQCSWWLLHRARPG